MTPTSGQTPARQNQVITAEEDSFLKPDATKTPLYRSDVGSDGGGKSKPQDWSQHIADGRILSQGNSVTGERGQLSRAYMPRYDLQDDVLRNICGLPVSDVLINNNTQEKRVYIYPDNVPPAIITKTLWHGSPDNSDRMDGARIVSITEEISRTENGGSISGNVQWDANKFEDAPIWVPGASAHNARYRFLKNGATATGNFRIGAYSNTPVGELHTLIGSGQTFTMYGDVYDTAVITRANLQVAVRAKTGRSTATISGTITAPAGGVVQSYTMNYSNNTGVPYAPAPVLAVTSEVLNGRPVYESTKFKLYHVADYFGGNPGWVIMDKNYQGGGTMIAYRQYSNAMTPTGLSFDDAGNYGQGPTATLTTGAVSGGTAGAANLSIQYNASAGNVGDIESSGDYIGTTIPYSTGGSYAFVNVSLTPLMTAQQIQTAFIASGVITACEVTDPDRLDGIYTAATSKNFMLRVITPSNTRVLIERVSGNRWGLVQVALGGTEGLLRASSPFFEPNQVITYLARDLTELNNIDWDNLQDQYGQGGDPCILRQAKKITHNMGDLWKGLYGLNGKRFATDLIAGARTVETTVTVPASNDLNSDCRFLRDTERSCVARGFYLVRRSACLELGYDNRRIMYVGRNQAMGFEIEAEQEQRTFQMERYQTPDNSPSMWWEVIQPHV